MISDKARYHKVIEYIYSHDKNIENIIEGIISQKIDKIINEKLQKFIPNIDTLNDKIFNLEESTSFEIQLRKEINENLENLILLSNESKISSNYLKQEIEKTQKSLEDQIAANSLEQKKSLCNEAKYLSMIDELKVQINNKSQQSLFYNQDEIESLKKKLGSLEKKVKELSSKAAEIESCTSSSEEECYLPTKIVRKSELWQNEGQKVKKNEICALKELFVYGIHNSDLRDFLNICGNVESIRALKCNSNDDQNMAIVKFKNIEGQINALNKSKAFYKDEQVHISTLNFKRTHNSFSYTILASNLPLSLSKYEIEDYFLEYGEIDQIDIVKDELGNSTGYAWIEFSEIEDVKELKKQNWISFDGRIIQIYYE
ncbi:unnamed protein product [Blepharisma stoltei]|uniref:RRM domain-containing protein n=1 Tax=Blepharisma stoltei TaxID=1481888 RepID=A0AAU9K770_9CILI|nr:unnamed protein product [Blepharisma stoltei]